MKKTIIVILIISFFLLAAALGLRGLTETIHQKEHIRLMETLLPGGKDFEKVPHCDENDGIISVHKSDKGYIIEASTQGYDDEIIMLVGVANSGNVTGLVTYRAHETLGLGSRILTDHVFLSQFLNKSGEFTVEVAGDDAFSSATQTSQTSGNEIYVDGISGATVSSKAVTRCVNAAVAYVTGADIDSAATSWGN